MNSHDFRCLDRLRVRRAEVDARGIVFDSHYLSYFDAALASYWRALALPYRETLARLQGDLYTRRSTLEHRRPAHADDLLLLGVRCARIGQTSIAFEGGCWRGDEWLARAELVQVFATAPPLLAQPVSQPVPAALRELLLGFEAGEPMVAVRVGRWEELEQDARPIRAAVFIDEQKIPAEMEWDAADAGCVHAVAYNRLGMPLATGRLLEHVPGTAKIGRMAVLSAVRGSGVGRAVLRALMDCARERGERDVLLHAQTSAAPFYQRAGFQARGPEFDEAGIVHVEMVRGL